MRGDWFQTPSARVYTPTPIKHPSIYGVEPIGVKILPDLITKSLKMVRFDAPSVIKKSIALQISSLLPQYMRGNFRRRDQRLPQLPPRDRASLKDTRHQHNRRESSPTKKITHHVSLHYAEGPLVIAINELLYCKPPLKHHLPFVISSDAEAQGGTWLRRSCLASYIHRLKALLNYWEE